MGRVRKEGSGTIWLVRREDPYDRKKLRERIRAKIANPGQPG